MFGLGWSEMVIIGVVALIVIGPKDLPNLFRTLGQFTGKARRMAREFSQAMEAAADDAGVKDIQKTINAAANPTKYGSTAIRNQFKPGGETAKLSAERSAQKAKMDAVAAQKVAERKQREADEAAAAAASMQEAADDLAEADLPDAPALPEGERG